MLAVAVVAVFLFYHHHHHQTLATTQAFYTSGSVGGRRPRCEWIDSDRLLLIQAMLSALHAFGSATRRSLGALFG